MLVTSNSNGSGNSSGGGASVLIGQLASLGVCMQMLPEEVAADGAPTGGRYDHVIRLFGKKFVEEKIMNARTFMVGTVTSFPSRAYFHRCPCLYSSCCCSWPSLTIFERDARQSRWC